jgi:O-glycosyl hydrolase
MTAGDMPELTARVAPSASKGATASTVAGVSAFGATLTSDQKVAVIAVNKNVTVTPVTLQLQNSTATALAVYSVKVGDTDMTAGTDITAMSSMFSATLAASSVTLFVSK